MGRTVDGSGVGLTGSVGGDVGLSVGGEVDGDVGLVVGGKVGVGVGLTVVGSVVVGSDVIIGPGTSLDKVPMVLMVLKDVR